ncbi:MAG: zinc-ribbon domain-containing protein [Eubacteriales bacterium]
MGKFCTNCGKELDPTVLFCTECGAKVEVLPEEEKKESSGETPKQKSAENTIGDPSSDINQSPEVSGHSTPVSEQSHTEPQAEYSFQASDIQPQPPKSDSSIPAGSMEYAHSDHPAPDSHMNRQTGYHQPNQQPYQSANQQYQPTPPTTEIPDTKKHLKEKSGTVSMMGFFGLELLFSLPLVGWIFCVIMMFAPKNENIKNFARSKLIWVVFWGLLLIGVSIALLINGPAIVDALARFWENSGIKDFFDSFFAQFPALSSAILPFLF